MPKSLDEALPRALLGFFDGTHNSSDIAAQAAIVNEQFAKSQKSFQRLTQLLKLTRDVPTELVALKGLLQGWCEDLDQLSILIKFNHLKFQAKEAGLLTCVSLAESWLQAKELLTERFSRAWYSGVLREAFQQRPELGRFDRSTHEATVREFRDLDTLMQEYNRAKVSKRHFSGMPKHSAAGSLGWLQHQFELKRNHKPIRTAMKIAGEAIQAIKPVFMMSPLSVAMYLPPDGPKFDLVIFDEASQIKPEDAFGAIIRGSQAIVVGDSQQMPPTSFFEKATGFSDDGPSDDDDQPESNVTRDMESVLALMGSKIGNRRTWLRWHYRSKHDSLIQVSNHLFYEDNLVVFPNPTRRGDSSGVMLHYMPNTVYARGTSRRNVLEARAIAEAVKTHVRSHRDLSLGVAAFSQAQQQAIQDELELLMRGDRMFEEFSKEHPHEELFVKNLENIQGDERDVIFISVGYGKDESGNAWMSFGPLNRDGGERRLNVLITRARLRCEIFTNLRSSDILASSQSPRGLYALKEYLHFAETGQLGLSAASSREEDSPFEAAVLRSLRSRGYEADPQIGSCGFYVDIGVRDPRQPGRYAIGVECDGAMYHSARSARDRDKLREAILVSRGWTLHRIWSTDWYQNREREERRLLEAVQRAIETETQEGSETVRNTATSHFEIQRDAPNGRTNDVVPIPPYKTCPIRFNLGALQLSEVDPSWLANFVVQICQVEAPIHVDEVVRKIREGAGVSRTGPRIKQHLDRAIWIANTQRGIEKRGDFLYIRSSPKCPLRSRSALPLASRKLSLVSDEEICEALKMAVRASYGIAASEACSEAIALLGFDRATSKMTERVNKLAEFLVQQGSLNSEAGLLRVNKN